jgi:tRNA/rRNA methyltransferase
MAENIGAVARAMKNFGAKELRLVKPDPFDYEKAEAMACAGSLIVRNARVYASLSHALADCHFSIATTRRSRRAGFSLLEPKEAIHLLFQNTGGKAALVFGPERTGLTNEEVYLCDSASMIPTTEDGSMNIAQSSVVYLYEWFQHREKDPGKALKPAFSGRKATQKEKEVAYSLMHEILEQSGFHPLVRLPDFVSNIKRLFEQRPLTLWEYQVMVKALRYVKRKIERE